MTEHAFMTACLVIVAFQGLLSVWIAYRALRTSERTEAITAATFLEVRKVLERAR